MDSEAPHLAEEMTTQLAALSGQRWSGGVTMVLTNLQAGSRCLHWQRVLGTVC